MGLVGWKYKREIQLINTTSFNLENYIVGITLDSSNFDFSKARFGGSDIRFTGSDGVTLLDYYIEDYNYNNQKATIWIKVPLISANQTKSIYMYYGNMNAVSQSDQSIMNSGFQYNPDPFNDGSCLAFYPLDGNANDYSENEYHGTWHGNEQYDNGVFGHCAKFDGSSAILINFGFKLQCPFVYTGWFKPNKIGEAFQVAFGWDYGGQPSSSEFDYRLMSTDTGQTWYLDTGAHGSENSTSSVQVPDNTWVFFYAEFRSSGIRLILKDIDGNLLGDVSKSVSITQSMSTKVALGAWIWDVNRDGLTAYFSGSMDHVRVFNRALTDDEIFLLSTYIPSTMLDEVQVKSRASGVIVDTNGNPIINTPIKIYLLNPDTGHLVDSTDCNTDASWEINDIPAEPGEEVISVFKSNDSSQKLTGASVVVTQEVNE